MEAAHLSLHKLVEEFCLSGHDLGQVWRWRWRLLRTAVLICPESFWGSVSSSNHLKQRRYTLSIISNPLVSDTRILIKIIKHKV
jgi:hypothetical protein